MTTNKKGRADCHQATLKTSIQALNFTGLAARVKGCIVPLALWGLLHISVTIWLINLGGQSDA